MRYKGSMNTSYTKVSIGNHTLTFEEYRAVPTRDERIALRRSFINELRTAFQLQREVLDQIRKDADERLEEQTRGMKKEFPKRLTKAGKPDRRYGMRINPEYAKHRNVRDQVVRDLSDRVAPVTSTFQYPYAYDEVFNAWEEVVETPWDQFQRLLSCMDWYSAYSDDYSYVVAGDRRMSSLQHLIRTLGPDAQLAFNRACPWLNEDGTHKAA